MLRFYLGVENEVITPEYSETNPAAHYAWCLEQAISLIKKSVDIADRKKALGEFKNNMNATTGTKIMFSDADTLLERLVSSDAIKSNDYIIEFLLGFMVPDKGYIEYGEQLSPRYGR